MIKENNSIQHLKMLYMKNKITLQQFFFRKEAGELKINTYKYKENYE
tara:strand:- start:1303 stop:1443 length:141 start_codon:yes stop_codon:yes gene_type:complete